MSYDSNKSYIWNRPNLFTLWFNNFKCTKFLFFMYFNVFYVIYFQKEKYHIRRNINSKKRNVYMQNQYYYFDLPKVRFGRARTTKNYVVFTLYQKSFTNNDFVNKIKCMYWFNHKIVTGSQRKTSWNSIK